MIELNARSSRLLIVLLVALSHLSFGQIDSIKVKLDETTDLVEKVDILNELCKQFWFSNLSESIKFGNQALNLAKDINYKEGEATSLNNLGVAAWVQGDYTNALDLYYTSINLRELIGGDLGLGNTYHNIGNIYRSTNKLDEAVIWFEKALKIRYKINDELGISYSKNNLGLIAKVQGDYQKALEYLNEGLDIRRKIKNDRGVATSLQSIGELYLEVNELKNAENHINEALKIWIGINHLQGQAKAYLILSEIELKKGDLNESLLKSSIALEIAQQINPKSELLQIHKHRAEIFIALNQYENALKEQSLAIIYKDSIYNENTFNIIQQRNLEQIAFKNKTLEKQNELQNELLEEQKRIYNAIIVICFLLAISLLLIYGVLRLRNKKNSELQSKNIFISEQKRIIEEANTLLEHKVQERTKELKLSNERLIEYSLFNSHKIRGPIARLLGLTYLSTISTDEDIKKYIQLIDISAKELDEIVQSAGNDLTAHLDNLNAKEED